MSSHPIVIVGGGAAGASVAHGLRTAGYGGRIALVGDERLLPYERPPLSKDFLLSKTLPENLLIHQREWYDDNRVELHLGVTATRLDLRQRSIELGNGRAIRFDKLALATGGRPRRLSVSGANEHIHYLRTVTDAERLKSSLSPGSHLLLVGAGFLGGEIAAAARAVRSQVTMVEALAWPLLRVLGPRLGQLYAEIHRENGVTLLTDASVRKVSVLNGHSRVELDDGTQLEADNLGVGIGLMPNIELSAQAGLETRSGVIVDEYGRTSNPHIFACGDVAEHYHPLAGRHLRVEHHDHALKQGHVVGANLAGARLSYDEPHWFWSDQYDYNLQAVGILGDPEGWILRGSIDERKFVAFNVVDDRLVGAVGMNSGIEVRRSRRLIMSCNPITKTDLADGSVDLRDLLVASEEA